MILSQYSSSVPLYPPINTSLEILGRVTIAAPLSLKGRFGPENQNVLMEWNFKKAMIYFQFHTYQYRPCIQPFPDNGSKISTESEIWPGLNSPPATTSRVFPLTLIFPVA